MCQIPMLGSFTTDYLQLWFLYNSINALSELNKYNLEK